jgi:hypothetical protein
MRTRRGAIREIVITYGDIILVSSCVTCIARVENCATTVHTLPLICMRTSDIFVKQTEYQPYSIRKPISDIYNDTLRDYMSMCWTRAAVLPNAELCTAIDQWLY